MLPCLILRIIKKLCINFFRLHGSYEALKYGTSLDGLSDLTGGIAESIPLKPDSTNCFSTLGNLLKMTSIVLCKVDKENEKDPTVVRTHKVLPLHIYGEAHKVIGLGANKKPFFKKS
jgi:hypothetical protein